MSGSDLASIREALSGKPPGAKAGGDVNWYSLPKSTDEIRLRVLLGEGKDFPFKHLLRHYNIPSVEGSLVCPSTFGIECPICNTLLDFEGRLDLSEWAAAITCYANVLVLKDKSQKINAKEVMALRASKGILKWFADLWEDEEAKTICDPYEGRDVIIKRKKFNGAFDIRTAFSATPITEDEEELQTILSKIFDFDKMWNAPNDNDIHELSTAAAALREVIDNKILSADDGDSGGGDPDLPDNKMPEEEVPTPGQEEMTQEEQQEDPPPPPPTRPATRPPAKPVTTTKPAVAPKAAPAKAAPASRPATSTASKPAGGTKTATPPPKTQPKPAQAAAKPPPAKAPAAKPATKTRVSTPADAPECFANPDVYDENSNQCCECPHEFNCREIIEGGKA